MMQGGNTMYPSPGLVLVLVIFTFAWTAERLGDPFMRFHVSVRYVKCQKQNIIAISIHLNLCKIIPCV